MSGCHGAGRLERFLFALAGTVVLSSVVLSLAVNRWFLVAAAVAAFNQWLYALSGSCPASLVLRRLGLANTRDA